LRQQPQYPLRVDRTLLRHAVEFPFEKLAHEAAGDRAFLDDEQLVVVKRRPVDRLGAEERDARLLPARDDPPKIFEDRKRRSRHYVKLHARAFVTNETYYAVVARDGRISTTWGVDRRRGVRGFIELVEAKPPLFLLGRLVATLGRRVVQIDGHGLAAVGFTGAAFLPKGFARQAVVHREPHIFLKIGEAGIERIVSQLAPFAAALLDQLVREQIKQ